MASDASWRTVAVAGGVLVAGAAAALAARAGLYATAASLALAGGWLAAMQVAAARRGVVRIVSLRAPPGPSEALLLRAMLDTAPIPLLLLEPHGSVSALNRAARSLFGVDDRLAAPAPALVAALRDGRIGERRRMRLSTAGAAPRLYAFSLAEIAAVGGPLRVGALLDVQAEVHIAEAESLRGVLTVLSHELGNSLTPIASLADTALHALDGDASPGAADARAALEVIARRGEGLARFVDGYRAAARLPEPHLRLVDVRELAADVVALVRRRSEAAAVAITPALGRSPVLRITDPDLLAQALTNLILNAVQAAAEARDAPAVTVALQVAGEGIAFHISDNGPGVAPEDRDRIFLPLVSSKWKSSGVGLPLARTAARSLGGEVEITRLRPTTTFSLTL